MKNESLYFRSVPFYKNNMT